MDDIDLAIKASIEALNGLAEECRTLNGKWPEFHHALVRFERDESPEIVRLAGNVAGGYEWLTPSMNIFGPLPLFVMLPSPPLFSSCHVIKGPPWLEGGREAFERLREISKRIIRRMRMIEADRIPGISSDDEVKINPLFPFIVMEWVHSCAEMNRHDSELHHESHKRIRGRDMPETTVAYTLPGGIFQAIEWALRIEVRELTTRHPVAVIEAPAPSEDEPPATAEATNPSDPLTLDDRAVALLTRWIKEGKPRISKRGIARALDCHHSSLDDCETFCRLLETFKRPPKAGYWDARNERLEAVDNDD